MTFNKHRFFVHVLAPGVTVSEEDATTVWDICFRDASVPDRSAYYQPTIGEQTVTQL